MMDVLANRLLQGLTDGTQSGRLLSRRGPSHLSNLAQIIVTPHLHWPDIEMATIGPGTRYSCFFFLGRQVFSYPVCD